MAEEVDKIKIAVDDAPIDESIKKLGKLEDAMDKVDGKTITGGLIDGAKQAGEAVDDAAEKIDDNLTEIDKKIGETGGNIAKTGKDLSDIFKKATLVIMGTAAAIGLASSRLNSMKADAISAGVSVRTAQVGGGVFESAGASGSGYTSALSNLRNVKSDFALGDYDEEFLKRLSFIGLSSKDLERRTPEDLADTIIKSAETQAAKSPEDLDVIRSHVQVLLGEEFASVFDYNQALGRSWEDLKAEFSKFSFITEESAKANADFYKEFQKTELAVESIVGELTGAFAEDFRKPLEDFNTALATYSEDIVKAINSISGGAKSAYDATRESLTESMTLTGEAFSDGSTLSDKIFLPQEVIEQTLTSLGFTKYISDALKDVVPEGGLRGWLSGENIDNIKNFDSEKLSYTPDSSLSGMEKMSGLIERSSQNTVNNSNQSSAGNIIINGPVVQIDGANPANLMPENIGVQTEKVLRRLILPDSGVRPNAE